MLLSRRGTRVRCLSYRGWDKYAPNYDRRHHSAMMSIAWIGMNLQLGNVLERGFQYLSAGHDAKSGCIDLTKPLQLSVCSEHSGTRLIRLRSQKGLQVPFQCSTIWLSSKRYSARSYTRIQYLCSWNRHLAETVRNLNSSSPEFWRDRTNSSHFLRYCCITIADLVIEARVQPF